MAETGLEELRRGWKVILAATVGIGTGLTTFVFYTTGVFVQPLSKAFGWADSQIMVAVTIVLLGGSALGPLIGMVTDRFGARRVALLSVIGAAVGWLGLSLTTGDLWMFQGQFLLLTLIGAGTLPVTWTRSVIVSFDKCRGMALGLCLVGTGLFGSGIKLLTYAVISAWGWRAGYAAIGCALLLITLPVTFFFLRDAVQPNPSDSTPNSSEFGLSLPEALRTRHFWLMTASFLLLSLSIAGIAPNLERFLTSSGFTIGQAVQIAAFYGIGIIAGRLFTGVLLDRFWAPAVVLLVLLPSCLTFVVMAGGVHSVLIATMMVFLVGTAAGVEYDALAFLIARYFGRKAYSAIYGSIYIGFAIGAGFGPLLFTRLAEILHGYGAILYGTAGIVLLGSLLLLPLGRYPQLDRAP
jgi:MFS family permease